MKIGPKYFSYLMMVCLLPLIAAGCSDPAEEARIKAHNEQLAKIAKRNEEKAKVAAEVAAAVYRPGNTNPNAFTKDGGRRTDDPAPQKLPASAFGEGQVVITVTHLNDQSLVEYLFARFGEMGATSRRSEGSGENERKFTLRGVGDANAVAAVIDFGDVVNTDAQRGLITVKADSTRLPHPELPIDTFHDGKSYDYTAQQLVDHLASWSFQRRKNACEYLGKMTNLSGSQKEHVLDALQIRSQDVNHSVQLSAKRALADLGGEQTSQPGMVQSPAAHTGVTVQLVGDLNLQQLGAVGNQLKSLTGATSHHVNYSINNGQKSMSIQLSGLDDAEAVAKKLTMFDVDSVSTANRRVNIRFREGSIEALAKTINKASAADMAAEPGTPTLASLLTDAAPVSELPEQYQIESIGITVDLPEGFTDTNFGPVSMLKNEALKTVITILVDSSDDIRKIASKFDTNKIENSGGTVLNHQAVNLHGRMAWLTRLRNVTTNDGVASISSVAVRFPNGIISVNVSAAGTPDAATMARLDAILNSISFLGN